MTSRERVAQSLRHQPPDRVPVDFWSTREADQRLLAHLQLANREELLTAFGVDCRYIAGPKYTGPPLETDEAGNQRDLWGVSRRRLTLAGPDWQQSYWEVVESPLARCETSAEVAAYPGWPSPDWFDYSVVREQCLACGDACRVFEGDRLNRLAQLKPAMYLRGVEQILVDLRLAPDLFAAIVGRIREFCLEYQRRTLEAAEGELDLLMTGDDFGTQHGLFISVADWRSALRPGFEAFIALAHQHDVPVMHHTCGSIVELLPEFVDCGLDVLQGLQPGTQGMDLPRLKREYGRDLAFQGGIGIQHALPRGTPEEVREEARQVLETMSPGGGYLAATSHAIQADVPPENVLALVEAYREFGG
jgi:uroporphyrinogen decarboxylase